MCGTNRGQSHSWQWWWLNGQRCTSMTRMAMKNKRAMKRYVHWWRMMMNRSTDHHHHHHQCWMIIYSFIFSRNRWMNGWRMCSFILNWLLPSFIHSLSDEWDFLFDFFDRTGAKQSKTENLSIASLTFYIVGYMLLHYIRFDDGWLIGFCCMAVGWSKIHDPYPPVDDDDGRKSLKSQRHRSRLGFVVSRNVMKYWTTLVIFHQQHGTNGHPFIH